MIKVKKKYFEVYTIISVEVQEDILLWFAEFSIMHMSQIELFDCIR